jgi:DNA-binding CsgD family transcriptional regulator
MVWQQEDAGDRGIVYKIDQDEESISAGLDSEETDTAVGQRQVDDLVVRVYDRMLRHRVASVSQTTQELRADPAGVEAAVDTLIGLKLIRPAEDAAGHFVAVGPDVAEVELVGPLEQAIRSQHRKVAAIRGLLRPLADTFNDVRRALQRQDPVVVTHAPEETRLRLADAARNCRSEVMTMQPGGGRDPEELGEAAPRDLEMVDNGIRMRILYQHTARTDISTRTYVRAVVEAGAEVRTTNEIFDRLIIFDRETAFIPQRPGLPDGPGAAIVHEPATVALLCRIYDHIWRTATVFDTSETAYGGTLDDVRTTILALLATGMKDEGIARRLGMSSRTCRRHISSLMAELHADSRFQAGVAAVRAGLLPDVSAGESHSGEPASVTANLQ